VIVGLHDPDGIEIRLYTPSGVLLLAAARGELQ
jgi:hypothetical protein